MIENVILSRRVKHNEKWTVLELCNILNVEERRNVYALEFVYKHVFSDSRLSSTMRDIFKFRNCSRDLRDNNKLEIPNFKKTFGQNSPHFQIIQLWNDLPFNVKDLKRFHEFSREIRQFYMLKRPDFYR